MSTRGTINSLRTENKDLLQRTKDDMQKLIAGANSIDKVLKDYHLLLTDAYRSDMVNTMRKLHEISSKIERHQIRFDVALQAPGGDFRAQLEQMAADDNNESDNETFNELTQLREIINRSSVSTAAAADAETSGTRRSRTARRTNDEIEMVEAEESHIDPLSKAPIKNAVRNKRCHHLYCYTTVLPYIRSITYPRCPIAGCHLPHIREDDLEFVSLG